MLKKTLLLAALLSSAYCASAQLRLPETPITTDSLKKYLNKVTDSALQNNVAQNINHAISGIVTGQADGLGMANYGSFEPVNGAFKFNMYGVLNKKKYNPLFFNVSAKGEIIGDNVGVLFNESNINTGTTVSAKLHFPLQGKPNPFKEGKKPSGPAGRESRVTEIRAKIRNLYLDAEKKRADLSLIANSTYWESQYNMALKEDQALFAKEGRFRDSLIKIQKDLDKAENKDSLQKQFIEVTEITRKVSQLRLLSQRKVDSLTLLSSENSRLRSYNAQLQILNDSLDKKANEEYRNLQLKASNVVWLTATGDFNRVKYYQYDESIPFAKIDPLHLNNFNYGLEFNLYIATPDLYNVDDKLSATAKRQTYWFINVGASRIHSSDIDDYKTVELSHSRKFASGDSTRTTSSKYNVYTNPLTIYKAWKLYTNLYRSFGKKAATALHLFSDVEFRDYHKNPVNAGVGVIFSVTNKAKSLFNVELYGKFLDVGKALEQQEKNMLRRNEIGLNFTVPFITTKK